MSSIPDSFLSLSASLTGFSPVVLRGTGMGETYLGTLRSAVSAAVLDRLLPPASADPASGDRASLDAAGPTPEQMLADPDLGPVARALIVLWYSGTWTQLPDEWRARNGALAGDVSGVVSSAAYQSGLQWSVIGAHPAGARQQGYGSWTLEPAVIV